jgi:hypothetical protein
VVGPAHNRQLHRVAVDSFVSPGVLDRDEVLVTVKNSGGSVVTRRSDIRLKDAGVLEESRPEPETLEFLDPVDDRRVGLAG